MYSDAHAMDGYYWLEATSDWLSVCLTTENKFYQHTPKHLALLTRSSSSYSQNYI